MLHNIFCFKFGEIEIDNSELFDFENKLRWK